MLTGIKIKNYFPKEKQSANIALLVNSIKHTRKKKKNTNPTKTLS